MPTTNKCIPRANTYLINKRQSIPLPHTSQHLWSHDNCTRRVLHKIQRDVKVLYISQHRSVSLTSPTQGIHFGSILTFSVILSICIRFRPCLNAPVRRAKRKAIIFTNTLQTHLVNRLTAQTSNEARKRLVERYLLLEYIKNNQLNRSLAHQRRIYIFLRQW